MTEPHPGITAGPRVIPPAAPPPPVVAPDGPTIMQTATANAIDQETRSWRANIPFFLMVLVTGGLFALIAILCFHEVPEKNASIVYTVVGTIGSGWMIGVGYFWGTSASSKSKDTAISALAAK